MFQLLAYAFVHSFFHSQSHNQTRTKKNETNFLQLLEVHRQSLHTYLCASYGDDGQSWCVSTPKIYLLKWWNSHYWFLANKSTLCYNNYNISDPMNNICSAVGFECFFFLLLLNFINIEPNPHPIPCVSLN